VMAHFVLAHSSKWLVVNKIKNIILNKEMIVTATRRKPISSSIDCQ
jgi:hypothetical protein